MCVEIPRLVDPTRQVRGGDAPPLFFSVSTEMTLLSAERKSLDSSPLSDMAPTTASALAPGGTNTSGGGEDPELRMMEKREKVVEELLQTEKDYIKDLQMCVSEIVEPLQRKQVGGSAGVGGGSTLAGHIK